MGQAIPDYPVDLFSHESVRNARAVDDALREFSPVVRLAGRHRDDHAARGRDRGAAGLADVSSNKSRPWHDPKSLRPEILLTDDPPRHTHVRQAMPGSCPRRCWRSLRPSFERDAARCLTSLLARQGETIDAVREITQRFVYKALPDAIGLRVEGREHMYAFSHMVWATMGPENELFREAMVNLEPVLAWLEQCCDRDNLTDGGIGMVLYGLADDGVITQAEAKLLLQTVLAAGCGYHDPDHGQCHVRALRNLSRAISEAARRSGPGARRLRRKPALGLALAHGRAHYDAARSTSEAIRCPPGSASG